MAEPHEVRPVPSFRMFPHPPLRRDFVEVRIEVGDILPLAIPQLPRLTPLPNADCFNPRG